MQTIGCHEQLQIQYIQSFFVTHPQPFPTGLELSKSFFLAVFPFLPLPSEPSQPQFKRLTAAIVCFDSWACNTLRHHFGSLAILHKCNPLSFFNVETQIPKYTQRWQTKKKKIHGEYGGCNIDALPSSSGFIGNIHYL